MAAPTLRWDTASVSDATLTVELDGTTPKGWKGGFERTIRLLGGGDWGRVTIKKKAIRVRKVRPGDEDRIRHFLESVIEQANASHGGRREPPDRGAEGPKPPGPDGAMTERFRSFAAGQTGDAPS